MPRLPHVPAELQSRPFRGSAAIRHGLLTPDQLRSRAWRRVWQDVYVHADQPDDLLTRLTALGLVVPPGTVVSGRTAALLHGVDVGRLNDPVELTVPRGVSMHPRPGISIRRAKVLPVDRVIVKAIPVTTPLRTAFDLARRPAPHRDLTEHAVAVDSLAHAELIDPTHLGDYARRSRFAGWRGVRQAMRVAGLAEPKAESPQESRVRMRIVNAGLPRPQAQVRIVTPVGVFYADLALAQYRIAMDYDGECHADQRLRDALRHNAISAAGWTHLVFTRAQMRRGDTSIVDQVREIIARSPNIPV